MISKIYWYKVYSHANSRSRQKTLWLIFAVRMVIKQHLGIQSCHRKGGRAFHNSVLPPGLDDIG
jgi:hypothetical protein